MVERIGSVIARHPIALPYCTDTTCCDPMERQEVSDTIASVFPMDDRTVALLDSVDVCPRCLRHNGHHSIHCHRHHSPVPID